MIKLRDHVSNYIVFVLYEVDLRFKLVNVVESSHGAVRSCFVIGNVDMVSDCVTQLLQALYGTLSKP